MGLVDKIKGFMMQPKETFAQVKDEPMGAAIKYFVMIVLVYSVLMAILMAAGIGTTLSSLGSIPGYEDAAIPAATGGAVCAVGALIGILILMIIALFIGAAIIHIGVILFHGKNGYGQTVKAYAYGQTPTLLLGWIPFIGIIFSLWSLYIMIVGVAELQEMSTGKAIVAVLIIPIVIAVIIGCAIGGIILASLGSMVPAT